MSWFTPVTVGVTEYAELTIYYWFSEGINRTLSNDFLLTKLTGPSSGESSVLLCNACHEFAKLRSRSLHFYGLWSVSALVAGQML